MVLIRDSSFANAQLSEDKGVKEDKGDKDNTRSYWELTGVIASLGELTDNRTAGNKR